MKAINYLLILLLSSSVFSQTFHDTQGKLEVSTNGQATFTLPIAMPPSIKSVGPTINLIYTSGLQGGIAGQGWSISNISNISRISTRIDIDGYRDGVDFDDNDKLALNGQRLLLKSGGYLADGSQYETEVRSNDKIQLFGGGSTMYFLVTSPDGSRTWYGNYGGMNATDVTAFYIVRFEDVNGNFITYHYAKPYNKSLCITEIKFSANTSTNVTPLNKIVFSYTNATRSEYAYIKGIKVEKAELLNKVEVFTNNLLFRKYQLTHNVDAEGYQRVSQIQEFNGANEGANPIVFEYNQSGAGITVNYSDEQNAFYDQFGPSDVLFSGDFDGDNKLDFVVGNRLYKNSLEGYNGFVSLPFTPTKRLTLPGRIIRNNKLIQNQTLLNISEFSENIEIRIFNPGQPYQLAKTVPMLNVGYCFDNCTEFNYDETTGAILTGPGQPVSLCTSPTFTKDSNKYLEGDFNGDGISEILVLGYDETKSYDLVLDEGGVGMDPNGELPIETYTCQQTTTTGTYVVSARIINLDPTASSAADSAGNVIIPASTYFNGATTIGDFNGDGKDDVLAIQPNGYYTVIGFKQILTAPWVEIEILGQGVFDQYSTNKQILFGDYNGDTKIDLMIPEKAGNGCEDEASCHLWHIYYSNPNIVLGGSFFIKESHYITPYMPEFVYPSGQTFVNYYFAMDANKDGKSDLVRFELWYRNEGTNGWQGDWRIHSFINNIGNQNVTGNKFVNDYVSTFISNEHTINSVPIVANQKAKGLTSDLMILHYKDTEFGIYKFCKYLNFNKNFINSNTLKKVTQSGGSIVDEVFYSPLESTITGTANDGTQFYSSANSQNYPLMELKNMSMSKLVSKVKNTSVGTVKFQDFKYNGLTVDLKGLGMLGFIKSARSSWYLNESDKKIWILTESDPTKRGATVKNSSHLVNSGIVFNTQLPGSAINQTISSYNVNLNSSTGLYSILVDTQTSTDYLTDIIIEKKYNSYTPDYLLPDNVTVKNFLGSTLQGTTNTVTLYESYTGGTGSNYYIGRPEEITTTSTIYVNTLDGNPNIKSSNKIIDYLNGNVSRTEKKANGSIETLVEQFVYFTNGLLQSSTVSVTGAVAPYAVSPRTTSYTYDATNRFIKKTISPDGLFTENLSYHNLYGVVLQQKNQYNQTTTSTYDNWGKRTRVTDFLGKYVDYTYTRANNQYTTTEIGQDGSGSKVISDALARVISKGSKNIMGIWNFVSTEYDYLDRKTKDSKPHAEGATPTHWTLYHYDDYSRPIQTVAYTGKIVSTQYDGLTVTAFEPTMSKSKTMNANGHVISAIDSPGGTIQFKYDANGNLLQSVYDGIALSMTYDNWGRKTQLVDTSAGTYTYSYNAYGEILTEGTPKGTTNYTYDAFGKILTKAIVGLTPADATSITSTYTYDPTYKWVTNIAVANPFDGNNNYAYTYDLTGTTPTKQLKKTVETLYVIGSTTASYAIFTKELTFDLFGRVNTEASTATAHAKTSSKIITHTYKNGYKWQLKDGTTTLWQANTVDVFGNITGITLGNGMTTTNIYDQFGYANEFKNYLGTTNVLTIDTDFEPILGNLIKRYNSLFDYTENFQYDELDRLVQWDSTAETIMNLTFDSGVEGFTYEGVVPGYISNDQSKLKIHAIEEGSGSQKVILTNAPIGKKIDFSFDYSKLSGPGLVKAKLIEIDPITLDTYDHDLGLLSNGTFEGEYTVGFYSEVRIKVYIEQDPSNPTNFDPLYIGDNNGNPILPYATYYLDNLKVDTYTIETQDYDNKGRITENNIGQYQYTTAAKPYQNTSIFVTPSANNYYESRPLQNIKYNAFKAPIEITDEGVGDRINFGYNASQQRCVMYYGSTIRNRDARPYRKYYSGDGSMEIKTTFAPGNTTTPTAIEFITYIGGNAYTAPTVLKYDGTAYNYFYLHRDYQGSILAITNNSGAIVEKRLFDAWGSIVTVQDGSSNILPKLTFFDRGYTGHEHLESVGLINMNARLYDPKLHRFLQPDNTIQEPYNTQNYNRYAYCVNNPLKYTDVSGNVFGAAAALFYGMALAVGVYFVSTAINHQKITISGIMETITFAVISTGVTFGIGETVSTISNFYVRSGVQALAHGSAQGGLTALQGGKFWNSFASGSVSSIANSAWTGGNTYDPKGKAIFGKGFRGIVGPGGVSSVAFGSISGGAGEALSGGNFWKGAVTGLVVSLLNHYAHEVFDDEQKINIHSNADEWLRNGGYDPNGDISGMDESSRDSYVKGMRENVYPADILYSDAGNPRIRYNSANNGYGQYLNKVVTIYPKAFITNKSLFLTIMHEGLHAWDYHHGLIPQWGKHSRAITETRAYEMMRYFDSSVLSNFDHSHYYDLYSKMASQSGFNNYSIQSYPIFFNNIQR